MQNTLVQKYCEILPYPRPTWSRTIPPTPRTQSATKTFDFQGVQTLRTKLAESVVAPFEMENQSSVTKSGECRAAAKWPLVETLACL